MAVDTNLIKGAYAANQPVVTKSGSAEGLMIMGDKISQGQIDREVEEEKKKQDFADQIEEQTNKASSEYDGFISKAMNEGDLTDVLHDTIYTGLSSYKSDYEEAFLGNDKKQMSKIQNITSRVGGQIDILNEIQDVLLDQDPNKPVSTFFTNTDLGKKIYSALSNKDKSVSFGKDGLEINIGGTKMSIEDLEALVNKTSSRDKGFESFLDNKLKALQTEFENFEDGIQPKTKLGVESLVRQQVTSSSNLNSLVYDSVIGGTSLYADLFEDLRDKSYGDLGITPEMMKDANIKTTDKIDADDVMRLLEELKSSKEGKEVIVQYYTKALLQGFEIPEKISDNTLTGPLTEGESGFNIIFDPNK